MNFRKFQMFTYTFLLISFVSVGCDPGVAKTGINSHEKFGWTPLNQAISDNDIDKVFSLLDSGADVNATNSTGYSPLMISIINGNEKIFLELLKEGADNGIVCVDGTNAMSLAIMRKNSRFIKLLNFYNKPNKVDDEGWPLIVNTAANGDLSEVKVLLYGDADIDSTNPAGWSALMIAIKEGQTEIAEYLIEEGANLNIKAKRGGFTALSIAKREGNREVIFLIELYQPNLSEHR